MIKFDNSTHSYSFEGTRVPSVSQIINKILQSDYSRIDPFYAERGTAVHKAVELYLEGMLDEDSLDEHVYPYFQAFLDFEKSTGFMMECSELKVFSKRLWFAGTLDLIGSIGDQVYLLDIKTGGKQKWHNLQTAGYSIGYNFGDDDAHDLEDIANSDYIKRGCIYLKKNGTYQLQPHADKKDFKVFESMAVVFNKHGEYK